MTFFDAVHYLGIAAVGLFGIVLLIFLLFTLLHVAAWTFNKIVERTGISKDETTKKTNVGITSDDFR